MNVSLLRAALLASALTPLATSPATATSPNPSIDQAAINAAIDRGVEWLFEAQRRDGSWGEDDLAIGGHRDPRNDLTSFCTYTLLKCKVPTSHPGIRRAIAFLEQGWPVTNYALSTQILALAATGDERHLERVEKLAEQLLEQRWPGHEIWGYPNHPSIQTDLSNTQFAVLALRAAEDFGVSVPKKVWTEMVERILLHQEAPRSVEDPNGVGTATRRQVAGFSYLLPNVANPNRGYTLPNASMTAAGLALIRIAEERLGGKLPRSIGRAGERAKSLAWAYLEQHFAATENFAGESAWIYYWLYGVERIGALYDRDRIGEHDWYDEGATELVKWQGGDGHWQQGGYQQWPRQPMPHANTCLALLFLVKATRGSSTGDRGGAGDDLYAAEAPAAEVHVRASGRSRLAMWVSGFGESIVEDFTTRTPDAEGMIVLEVRYLLDGEVVARVPGDEDRPWKDERYAAQYEVPRNGELVLEVQVVVRDDEVEGGRTVLHSDPLTVRARDVLEDWMLDCATFESRNLLARRDRYEVSASSHRGEWVTPDRAVDGLQATRWLSKKDDAAPTLYLEFKHLQGGRALVLAQADSSLAERGRHARVKRVAISINDDKEELEADLDPGLLRPTVIPFPKKLRIRRLSIRILDYEPGRGAEEGVGFAEVGLLD